MPLRRLKDLYLLQDGVRFLMADNEGSTVICRVSHEALQNHADRLHFASTDDAVFEEYRELIEDIASEAFDAGGLRAQKETAPGGDPRPLRRKTIFKG